MPVTSDDQNIPAASNDQDVPVTGNDQGVPATSNDQDIPITGNDYQDSVSRESNDDQEHRYPRRSHRPPQRYADYVAYCYTERILCGGSRCNRYSWTILEHYVI